jgi:hypothetical protein
MPLQRLLLLLLVLSSCSNAGVNRSFSAAKKMLHLFATASAAAALEFAKAAAAVPHLQRCFCSEFATMLLLLCIGNAAAAAALYLQCCC